MKTHLYIDSHYFNMTIYETGLEHLLEEFQRIHLIISFYKKWKTEYDESKDDFQGFLVKEKEVDAILQNPPFKSWLYVHPDPGFKNELDKINKLRKEIDIKKEESLESGKELRLHTLSETFHLSSFEVDVLLLCLLSELDLRYEKVYSYAQDDVTRKRPTVDLIFKYLSRSPDEMFSARKIFSPASSLLRNRLIHLAGDGQDGQVPLLSKSIKLDERIIGFLLGSDGIDQRIRNFSSMVEPKRSFDDLILADDHMNILNELMKHHENSSKPMMLYFHGPYGTGKKMTAEAICTKLRDNMLIVDSRAMMKNESSETLKIILREALLHDSCVYLEGIDALWKEKEPGVALSNLIQELDGFPDWVFLSGEEPWEPSAILQNHGFINIAFPVPSFAPRKMIWDKMLNSKEADINALASKFKFSGGQIRDAIFTARNVSAARGSPEPSIDDLFRGCKAQSNKNLSQFARKIEPRYKWEDIVLPKDAKQQLNEVSWYIKYRGIVYTDWGFDNKSSLGKGLNVLFTGPSGTGKTMAAEIIAKKVDLDLYKIDLSSVVSKYIGETEKNLRNIFKEAETSNAILFFDEADALFGKRSEVKDSHDRYANIEINYLLQKMEEYEGIVILATNFGNNIDDAFLRRMHFKIEFSLPDEKQREKIWRHIFPEETKVEKDLDYSFLSKFKITGGNIKNIALTAAFLAAADSGKIKIEHIIRATMREFQKIGMLCTPEDFGKYHRLINEFYET